MGKITAINSVIDETTQRSGAGDAAQPSPAWRMFVNVKGGGGVSLP
jgi:hypothetical protein